MPNEDRSPRARRLAVSLGISALAIVLLAPMASAAPPRTKLASQSSSEVQGDGVSFGQEISATGRYVAFDSDATNLVSGDGNGSRDVFIRDFKKGKTKLVSKATGGGIGNGHSWGPSVSASGRFVAFTSKATNYVASDPDNADSVYVRDTVKNKTELISRSSAGTSANAASFSPSISADGRWVAFESAATNLVNKNTFGVRQIYLFDRKNKKLSLVSRNKKGKPGNDDSDDPAISATGRYIAYESDATDLTPKNVRNREQIFLYDRARKKTSMVSLTNKGKAGNGDSDNPEISNSGARIIFNSLATNFAKDNNDRLDAYMRDRNSRKTRRVSLNWKGKQLKGGNPFITGEPDISGNG